MVENACTKHNTLHNLYKVNIQSHEVVLLRYEKRLKWEKLLVHLLDKQTYRNIINYIKSGVFDSKYDELISINFDEYKKDQLSSLKLHEVPCDYVFPTNTIKGNQFTSDCDTYADYYYHMYLFYCIEKEKYLAIHEKWKTKSDKEL